MQIAKDLLGKLLVTRFEGIETSARIVETEAYYGAIDRASHAYGNRRTKRTEIMFAEGGVAYVYLCYGIHHLFNIVTHDKDIPHAILIRGAEPVKGIQQMMVRTRKKKQDYSLSRGPGNVSKALGILTSHSGLSLTGKEIFLASDEYVLDKNLIMASPRIGVDYAGEDALLPYRFYIKGNPYVSGKNN